MVVMGAINVHVTDPGSCVVGIVDAIGQPLPVGEWQRSRSGHWHLRITDEDVPGALEVVLADPPGPDSCFVEVETDNGRSVKVGHWRRRDDGTWALHLTRHDLTDPVGRHPGRWDR
jgi:hypothetical protein